MNTTDNQNELFDVVDEKDNVIGTATRKEVHSNKNLIHRSIGVLVFNSNGELLLQQRSATKDTDPLKWTISCSGHVNSDTSTIRGVHSHTSEVSLSLIYKYAAQRELKEELGIEAPIEFVTKFLCRAPNETEMQVLFKAYSNGPFAFHQKEIIQGKFFTRKGLKNAVQQGKIELSFMGKVALGKTGWL